MAGVYSLSVGMRRQKNLTWLKMYSTRERLPLHIKHNFIGLIGRSRQDLQMGPRASPFGPKLIELKMILVRLACYVQISKKGLATQFSRGHLVISALSISISTVFLQAGSNINTPKVESYVDTVWFV